MDCLSIETPAKLNLVLNITGRRADGYHLLETAFQFIDWYDYLEFTVTRDAVLQRHADNSDIPPESDLVIRAARRLQAHAGVCRGAIIRIDKRIPIGGGLGGGSSDAAACLLALNQLWQLNYSLDQLAEIGLTLGADVPVFIRGRAAWATGLGEQLIPLDLPETCYLVIDPGVQVSTAAVFNAEELTRDNDPLTIRAFLRGAGGNVCEPVARRQYSEVGAALDWLGQFATARMSGTGGCVFAAFDSLNQAEALKSKVPGHWVARVVQAMNYNPVHRQLGLPV